MTNSHNAIHHRFEPTTARKMDYKKIIHSYFHINEYHDRVTLFTNQPTDNALFPNKSYCLAPLQIEQIYAHYQNASHPQTWLNYGYENLSKNKNLAATGDLLKTIFPKRELSTALSPENCLIQSDHYFKYISTPKSKQQQFFTCWSLAIKNIHPESFHLHRVEYTLSDAIQNFTAILGWAQQNGWKPHHTIIMTTPEPFLYKLHENIQIPDLEFGWAPSTTFLNWLETSGLFIDWTSETSVKGYLCHTLKS